MHRADRVLRESTGGSFTGAVARVHYRGKPVFEQAYGLTRADRCARPVYADTAFDLASITKVFTGTLALLAVQDKKLTLDEPVLRDGITLRMLLAHNSGMNSGADYRQLLGHNVVGYTAQRELNARPGERVVYSDLGFIALGDLLERTCGRSLPALLREMRPSPVFRPRAGQRAGIPATEEDAWRGRVQGFVHDEKAYLMGGVAGHAGLFGNAADVGWLAEQFLARLHGRASILDAELVREAIAEQAHDPVLRRGLGWALKTNDENSCGRYFSSGSFGHTGFVGTCVWADPQRDCSGVLLTNSVYFGRSDTRELRAAFYEAIVEDLGLQ